jgi:predicted metalloprotease
MDLIFLRAKNKIWSSRMILQQHIIAHEIGHHVQTLLGTSQNETNARRKVRLKPINIVALELPDFMLEFGRITTKK